MKTITILGYAFSLIKEDTKRAINILERASNDEGTSLWNVYGRNSEAKSDAMNECDTIDIQERLLHKPNSKKYYDFIIDDEGRFKSGNVETAITYDDNKKVIENFVGSFLVTRHTPNGDIKGLTEEEIEDVLASFGGGLMHLQL